MPSRADREPPAASDGLVSNSVEGESSELRLPQWKPLKFRLSLRVRKFVTTPGRVARLDPMRVLAIDASLRNTGVAVIDANGGKPRALYFGDHS